MKNFILLVIVLPALIGALLGYVLVAPVSVSANGATDFKLAAGLGVGALVAGFPGTILFAGLVLIEKIGRAPRDRASAS